MTQLTGQAAVDAFFVETRRIFAAQGVTERSLATLGEKLGELAARIGGSAGLFPDGGRDAGPSRLLRSDPDGLTLAWVRFTSPREPNPVHGHQAWWVLRVIGGHEHYTEWERLDDGSRERYAELRPGPRRLLGPGDVVLALDPVIHCHEDYKGETVDELMLAGENPGAIPIRRFDPDAKATFLAAPRAYAWWTKPPSSMYP